MKFTYSLTLLFSSFLFVAVAGGERTRKLSKSSKNKPTRKPPTPPPVDSLVAFIEPFGDDATALGTTTLSYNPDGFFLVSLELNFLTGPASGTVTITEGTSCDPLDSGFSTTPFVMGDDNPDVWNGEINFYDTIGISGEAISKSAFRISNGATVVENSGKTVHIVTSDGIAIGCGMLKSQTMEKRMVAVMNSYPEYDGPLSPSGTVTVDYTTAGSDVFVFSWDLKGLKENCEKCGIHIHAGLSCATPEDVLGHGWNSAVVQDLWTAAGGAFYNTNSRGRSTGFFNMYNGFGYEENFHHAVVIHTQDGKRVGCGVLLQPL